MSATTPVLIDTDIGAAIDDVFALALAVASPELEIVGVTTVGQPREDRAWIARRLLSQVGKADVPVVFGEDPQPSIPVDWQIQYGRHPAAIFDRAGKLSKQSAVELMADAAGKHQGKLTIVCLGPLTNVARLIREKPDSAKQLLRIVLMGGALKVGYNGEPPAEPEWNIKTDIAAAKMVLESGVPLVIVPLDATAKLTLAGTDRDQLFSAHTQLTHQVQNLDELSEDENHVLYDVAAVAAALDAQNCSREELRIEMDDNGLTTTAQGTANATVVTKIAADKFIPWFVDRVRSAGESSLPKTPVNRTSLVDAGGFPARVHVVEDFETDIEKRWWMSGKLETKNVPSPGGRACRAVMTQDFDDLQGDTATMYRAVVFNPVPGPPMGPNTLLSFRYKLHGTDTIRVQLYSLSNGYHRYLSVADLPQNEWRHATVDLTQMRRPDGSGGKLAADERIDDIQFYIDPRAELLIDGIVLYDASAADEQRPFPKRIVFSAWFDTGKQGAEWPGTFEILPHEKPLAWKFAESVPSSDAAVSNIRLSLRGQRRLDATTEVCFRYRLTGGPSVEIALHRKDIAEPIDRKLIELEPGSWREATVRFDLSEPSMVDEIRFTMTAKAVLQIDDVLLYTPSE